MSIRHGAITRRAVTAVLAAAALSLSTACGGGDSGSDDKKSSNSASTDPGKPQESGDGGGSTVPDKGKTLATINGSNGFRITVYGAARDEGGFLTVSGAVENTTSKRQFTPLQWSGQESQVKRTGPSLAGMTLVDKADKKRYYVLRDTDGFPLTTTGMSSLDSGKSVDFFAQFPAPPNETTTLDLQIPLMPTATIEIS
ncbi:hypothetical protein [Streptomyces sp. NPDC008141]|uniref:hypothetical protein n=1 Tax=Streptomyces sp. NPDC008141 TaxID=3364815 RepID=UPI0036ED78F2